MVTQKTGHSSTTTRFFNNLLGRNNEQKEEKESLPIQATTDLILKATGIYEAVPEALTDTIFTSELFVDLVLTKHGHVFERQCLETWLETQSKCPKTRKPLQLSDLNSQTPENLENKPIQDTLKSIIEDYTTARASFLELITKGSVTEDDILAYQETTTQAVADFQEANQSMFDAEIESELKILYGKSYFPPTIESYDAFCDQVSVLSDRNEWIPKSRASSSSYTEYPEITKDLWNLNNNLIKLNTALAENPSHQFETTISKLVKEHERILANMESIKQKQTPSRRDEHPNLFLFPDEDSSFLEYPSLDLETLGMREETPPSRDNLAPTPVAYLDHEEKVPVNNNMINAVSQSPQCSSSLFLKMISVVALANGILLLILLHTPVGFAVGITSLCIGGLTLFAASREKKHDAPSNASLLSLRNKTGSGLRS